MARATLLMASVAVLAFAAAAGASRDILQAPSGSASPPSATFGGPKPTIDASITPPAGNTVRLNWRGVGTQNFSSSSDSQYQAAGAVADLFLQNGTFVGKHLFINNTSGSGISPVFTRQDAQGNTIGQVVGRALANVTAPATNDNGGYGSIPFLLLEVTSATGFFQGITYIQRINTLGGIVPGNPRLFTLPSFQGKPNALLTVPYQADYLFFQSGGAPGSAPATGSAPASG